MKTHDYFLGNQPIELTNALFRVAGLLGHQELKSRIESWSVTFLESVLLRDAKSMARDIYILEHMIILGETIGDIPYNSSRVLYAQFQKIKSAIRQYEENNIANAAIDSLFTSKSEKVDSELPITLSELQAGSIPELKNEAKTNFEPKQVGMLGFGSSVGMMLKKKDLNPGMERKQLIVEKVRQCGNAAVKDLIAEFPTVSERTLRYDLQKLCDQLILERKGNGGPASFYRLRDSSASLIYA